MSLLDATGELLCLKSGCKNVVSSYRVHRADDIEARGGRCLPQASRVRKCI